MRYDDWDILLFPRDCKVPVKEFKVACHAVHDAEFSHTNGLLGVPTVSCFVPSLPSGTPFQVSVHSWSVDPVVSQFTRTYSQFAETAKYETRVFIDGRLVASIILDQKTEWPHVIAHGFEFLKNGDLGFLRFPTFRHELLQQRKWNAGDDLGRIKVVLSEGFPRDSLSMPFERVKNIVAFSFQHAPLETSSIAWPNPSLWRRPPIASSMPVSSYPSVDSESHAHSPSRRNSLLHNLAGYSLPAAPGSMNAASLLGSRRSVTQPAFSTLPYAANMTDPFGEANSYLWMAGMGTANLGRDYHVVQGRGARKASTDISMPDYMSNGSGEQPGTDLTMGMKLDEDAQANHLKVPTNTPTTGGCGGYEQDGLPFPLLLHNSAIPSDLANTLTNSLLNQPMPLQLQHGFHTPAMEVKSRKETRFQTVGASQAALPGQDHVDVRRVSQQTYMAPGSSVPATTLPSRAGSPQTQSSEMAGPFKCDDVGACINLTKEVPLSASWGSSAEGRSSADKGTKRGRNFTPASARAIDEEDEPQRASPRVRLTPFDDKVAE
ncbi:NADH dehydrogenase -like protein [Drechmeria coniospora]|uniref:NADH dehydrogenase-like protein n=1 Tax=Drechmeria coniospora TaxID=98403 RepID=A0A151GG76_DRECN|nr:NADH dehydrogenase -like protein [Drechmeria coniospora]KYK56095.1 NADH dehydrogenase -like protein [Drechmeria coniospora]